MNSLILLSVVVGLEKIDKKLGFKNVSINALNGRILIPDCCS